MFFYEGLSCPHCHRVFLESDDIVACPVCGAPHHRGCWGDAGGCACREDHGTERQWTRESAQAAAAATPPPTDTVPTMPTCPHCQAANSPYAEMCYRCGRPLQAQEWASQPPPAGAAPGATPFSEYAPFHSAATPYGGVDAKADLDGETAEDYAMVVFTNTAYYLPRFQHLAKNDSHISWNWSAFLLAPYWLMFRKQYLVGAVALLWDILCTTLANIVLYTKLDEAFVENAWGQASLSYTKWMELMYTDDRLLLATLFIGMLGTTMILFRVCIGLFGNKLYMSDCRRKIQKARNTYPEGYRAQLSMLGGTSFVLGLLGVLLNQTLPSLILSLLLH